MITNADAATVSAAVCAYDGVGAWNCDADQFYTYDFLDSPPPVTGYATTYRLLPITHIGQTLGFLESKYDRTAQYTAEMDQTHSKPMVACNTAVYWHALRAVGITDPVHGYGALLENH